MADSLWVKPKCRDCHSLLSEKKVKVDEEYSELCNDCADV